MDTRLEAAGKAEEEVTMNKPLPTSPAAWLKEIAQAYQDARETIPFGRLAGRTIGPDDLFHLGPLACLKFRGIRKTKRAVKQATQAAMSSYVATHERSPEVFRLPQVAFAFTYLAAHFGLGLVDEQTFESVMGYVEDNADRLVEPVEVTSADYALQEYALTPAEMAKAERRIGADIRKARRLGRMTKFTRGPDDFR